MQAKTSFFTPSFKVVVDKLYDYGLLVKFRLSFTVVFSSLIAYLIALQDNFSFEKIVLLFIGGFMITGAANALNQVFEKDVDRLMKRTMNRPLPQERMGTTEAVLFAGCFGLCGMGILWFFFNELAALLGAFSLVAYSFIYTPLKRITPAAVFIGALPGALPPAIGWVAATGSFGLEAFILFAIQFVWQFPHFWAIAWVTHEDYSKAGFKLLPSSGGQDRFTASHIVFYSFALIPVSLLFYFTGYLGNIASLLILGCGLFFLLCGIQLLISGKMKHAKKVMFASFIYLPIVLLILLFGGKI